MIWWILGAFIAGGLAVYIGMWLWIIIQVRRRF